MTRVFHAGFVGLTDHSGPHVSTGHPRGDRPGGIPSLWMPLLGTTCFSSALTLS